MKLSIHPERSGSLAQRVSPNSDPSEFCGGIVKKWWAKIEELGKATEHALRLEYLASRHAGLTSEVAKNFATGALISGG